MESAGENPKYGWTIRVSCIKLVFVEIGGFYVRILEK